MGLFDAINKGMNFLAPERERAQLENKALREGLLASKRQRQGINELSGLFAPNTAGPGIRATPQQDQQRLMQAALKIAPQAVSQSLLAPKKGERVPTDLAMLDGLGLDRTPENLAMVYKMKNADDPQAALAKFRLDREREQYETDQANQRASRQALADGFINSLDQVESILDENARLEGSVLETGRTFPEFRRAVAGGLTDIAQMAGGDVSQAREMLRSYNTFQKETKNFLLQRIMELDNVTDARTDILEQALPNFGADPATNRNITADLLRQQVQAVERTPGVRDKVPDSALQRAHDIIQRIKNESQPDFQMNLMFPGFNDLSEQEKAEIRSMTPQEIRDLRFGS